MKLTINIPKTLLEEAKRSIDAKTNTQTVILALEEMIQIRKSRSTLALKGSLRPRCDYKQNRKKC